MFYNQTISKPKSYIYFLLTHISLELFGRHHIEISIASVHWVTEGNSLTFTLKLKGKFLALGYYLKNRDDAPCPVIRKRK